MNVTKITVRSGQVRANPFEGYSNLQASITFEAELTPEDNEAECVRELQLRADSYVAQQIQQQIEAIHTRMMVEENRRSMAERKRVIDEANARILHVSQDFGRSRMAKPPYDPEEEVPF